MFDTLFRLELVTEDLQPLIHGSRFEEDLQELSSGLGAIYNFMDLKLRNDTGNRKLGCIHID